MGCILSLDCSTKSTGWCVLNKDTFEIVDYGRIELYKDEEPDMRNRVLFMMREIREIILKYQPHKIIAEDVPPTLNNSATLLALGILQGAILGMSAILGFSVEYISVSTWHSKLDIRRAKGDLKKQSIDWVNNKYNLGLIYKSPKSKFNEDDIADAICIGCYALGNFEEVRKFGRR